MQREYPQSGEETDETIAQETIFSLRCASRLHSIPIPVTNTEEEWDTSRGSTMGAISRISRWLSSAAPS